jgi:AcrR family transcriptional regulator
MPAEPPETVRDLRRGQIIAAAKKIVADEGLEALTIATLESRLSFTRGVITYHFKNKDEIVETLLATAVAEIDEALRQSIAGLDFEGQVRAVLRAQTRGYLEHPDVVRILFSFWGRLSADPRARKLNSKLYAGYRAQAVGLIDAGQKAGVCGPADPQAIAVLLVGIVLGIVAQVHFATEPKEINAEAAIEEAAEMVIARLSRKKKK